VKQTVEAIIDEQGHVHLLEPAQIHGVHRALVIILDDAPAELDEGIQLAERALLANWVNPEEDQAWEHLQRRRSK